MDMVVPSLNEALNLSLDKNWDFVKESYAKSEEDILRGLIPLASSTDEEKEKMHSDSLKLIKRVRADKSAIKLIDSLLMEFSLTTKEGIALMSLAETLMRVPDSATGNALIASKLESLDFKSYLGTDSLYMKGSVYGLLLVDKLLYLNKNLEHESTIRNLIKKLSEPIVRQLILQSMKIMGFQFVLGRDLEEAIKKAKNDNKEGYCHSFDMLGEAALTNRDANKYFNDYMEALDKLAKAKKINNDNLNMQDSSLSIKLSALFPRYESSKKDLVFTKMFDIVFKLILRAKEYDIPVTIDAEEVDRLELSLKLFEKIYSSEQLNGWNKFGVVVQAYSKYSYPALLWLASLAKSKGKEIPIRLVKGAYWDSEIKLSQQKGLDDYPVFTRKESTDISYLACARLLLDKEMKGLLYPQFATHNAFTVAAINAMSKDNIFEFQRLHGMGDALYSHAKELFNITKRNLKVRIYAPIGSHKDLLPYLVRRLLENGANSSFVHKLVDKNHPIEDLTIHPIDRLKSQETLRNNLIPRPIDILGFNRQNSRGINYNIELQYSDILIKMEPFFKSGYEWKSSSILSKEEQYEGIEEVQYITTYAPYNKHEKIGSYCSATIMQAQVALIEANSFFNTWKNVDIKERANYLIKFADNLEKNQDEFIALCHKEAGKTLNDSIDEIRETVDFCRYYAELAKNDNYLELKDRDPRGVYLCISPWNFPLAIFIGQISAALITGNTVIAKPAPQTSHIAFKAIGLLLETGIPKSSIQLLLGGSELGDYLTRNSIVDGVCFTGSTDTALKIQKNLSMRNIEKFTPIIAETGGQNTMIIDSTSLPEQVIKDVIRSAFASAGQRCSALRVLYIQEDIADHIITLLQGAMELLTCGDPCLLSTDIGPVIDESAQGLLLAHIEEMKSKATLIYQCKIEEDTLKKGFFVPPTVIEIEDINYLVKENFGPILHVIRYKNSELNKVIDSINNTGFGLTLGIHSRNQNTCNFIERSIRVGNTYINRDQIGAVVGVQPFGGQGLSGTGPKAGGPLYLFGFQKSQYNNVKLDVSCKIEINNIKNNDCSYLPSMLKVQDQFGIMEPNARIDKILEVFKEIVSLQNEIFNANFIFELENITKECKKLFKYSKELNGVTGESNLYYLKGRGIFALLVSEDNDISLLLRELFIMLAMGNSVIIVANKHKFLIKHTIEILKREKLDIVYQEKEIDGLIRSNYISGLSLIGTSKEISEIYQKVVEGSNSLKQLIFINHQNQEIKALELYPFIVERVKTTNLTAIGGNTSLLEL